MGQQKQYGILLLEKGVDGWVGRRAFRYQIIQELEKPVGKEGVIWRFLHFKFGVLVICPLSPLSCLFI